MEKEKLYSENVLYAVLAIGLVSGVVAGMAIYASMYPIFQSENWAAWAAAFATTSAAATALWLGLSDIRRKDRERREVMLIAASGVSVYLDELIIELKSAAHNILAARANPLSVRKAIIMRSKTNLARLDLDYLGREDLLALSGLPNNASESIYLGLTCAKLVKGALDRRGDIAESEDPDADGVLERWQHQAEYAVGLFEKAVRECHRVAKTKLLVIEEEDAENANSSPT